MLKHSTPAMTEAWKASGRLCIYCNDRPFKAALWWARHMEAQHPASQQTRRLIYALDIETTNQMSAEERATTADITAIAEAKTLQEAVGLAIGAAAMSWEHVPDPREFDGHRAGRIIDALLARIAEES